MYYQKYNRSLKTSLVAKPQITQKSEAQLCPWAPLNNHTKNTQKVSHIALLIFFIDLKKDAIDTFHDVNPGNG